MSYEGNQLPEEFPPSYQQVIVDTDDTANGRVEIDVDSKLGQALARVMPNRNINIPSTPPPDYEHPEETWTIKLNIVIQIVGSRGDVQPFIALGQELQKHGHRVRIATHDVFSSFVLESGLEFYPIGGDPNELMAYMVENPSLFPSVKALRSGQIQQKRAMVAEMLEGCWKSCIRPDPVTSRPFVADAIIANPPSFAHVHCAQALGVPVHLMFTMPWSSTRAFPHPLANVKSTKTDPVIANYVSYGIVEFLTWQGLGDVINKWRKQSLDLEPVPATEGAGIVETLKVPFTYCWSPALVPKPIDWNSHIDICGFFFRDPPRYSPSLGLDAWLSAGSPPVYIGFGSIVVDDPEKMTAIILEAIKISGVRAIISRGWSKLRGQDSSNIFYLNDCPHEWLFQHVAAVVHHGGAGTTACGLLNGRPTAIVPFFGDQPFWGNVVAKSGAGPKPIPYKALTPKNLADAIAFCLTTEAAAAAKILAEKMRSESGVRAAVKSFYAHLPKEKLQCDLLKDRPATWMCIKGKKRFKVSKLAASVLLDQGKTSQQKLKEHLTNTITMDTRRWEPTTAITSACVSIGTDLVDNASGIFLDPLIQYKRSQTEQVVAGPSKPRRAASSLSLDRFEKPLPKLLVYPDGSAKTSEESDAEIRQDLINPESSKGRGWKTAGAMAGASAKSMGNLVGDCAKGMIVDLPLAATNGFRAIPKLYGEEVPDHRKITDYKSGAMAAGENFVFGMYEGLTDIFTLPHRGRKEEGLVGCGKGVAKGIASLAFKTTSAGVGLVGYTGQGIAKSIHSTVNGSTAKSVLDAKKLEMMWLGQHEAVDSDAIIQDFERLCWKG